MFNYSIIIPHHNNPTLLKRLIDSIPFRNDIQIIIVDDASDENIINSITRLSFSKEKHIEIYRVLKENSKWAGHARNIGIEHARGKWLLFADSDDLYINNFVDILDNYKDSNYDVIYFNWKVCKSEDLSPTNKVKTNSNFISEYIDNPTDNKLLYIRYKLRTPWCKMINKNLVDKYNLRFEEVIKGNDVLFSILVGHYAERIKVIPQYIYIYTYRTDNMTFSNKDWKSFIHEYQLNYRLLKLYRFLGISNIEDNITVKIKQIIRILRNSKSYKDIIIAFYKIIFEYQKLHKDDNKYINAIEDNR